MQHKKYLYSFVYDPTESELCKLESNYIFNQEEKERLLNSDLKIDPSRSIFIKKRLDIISYSEDYATLIAAIKEKSICAEGFKVEYLVFDGDSTEYAVRLDKLRDIGYIIKGFPDYHKPRTTYALWYYEGHWCFGILIKNNNKWQKHKQKPCSYSQSIGANIAKALVNIASKSNKDQKLLDVCCGVGTIMLEACFVENSIEGCDRNEKICEAARENIAHFGYTAKVHHCDIQDIEKSYDAAIIDLPYNLSTPATENEILHIIKSATAITNRLVIVSTSDISNLIYKVGFSLEAHSSVSKRGKINFARRIWVCEKAN